MIIIRDNKIGLYGFVWRIITEDGLFELQRYSEEYKTWFCVQSSLESDRLIKLYDDLKS
jgi:hypothetical protein